MDLSTILLVAAAVLFGLASFGIKKAPIHLGWAGACLLALSFVL